MFMTLKQYRNETLKEYYQQEEQSSDTDTVENYDGLEISNTKGIDNQGVLIVSGDITNVGEYNVKKLVITAIFYDSSNEVVATQTDTYENIMFPKDSYHFKINCLKKGASSYSLEAQAVLQ
jgi:hypothetical protein